MDKIEKNPKLTAFLDEVLKTNTKQDIENCICVFCGGDANDFKNEISKKEFQISGFCQKCQDDVF